MLSVNKYISWAVLSMFIIEFLLILFSDFSENAGTTKEVAIIFFVLTYIWFTIPAVLSIILNDKLEQRKAMLMVVLILNTIIFIGGIPMFLAYW